MSELDKNKAGLQKKVSSVFNGVPVPQNNGTQQPSNTPAPNKTPGVPPEDAPANKQVPQNSLIKKLNQSEDSPDKIEQGQATNIFQKHASANQAPQSSKIDKLPQPEESLKQAATATQIESNPFIEEADDGLWQQIKDKLFEPKPGVSPTRQKAMVIMVPVLAIAMIFVLRQVLSKAPSQSEGAGIDDTPVLVSNNNSGDEIEWKIPEPIKVITRDPIKLPDEINDPVNTQNNQQNQTNVEHTSGTIMVRDIVYSKDKPSAVVGSKIVYVGDKVNGVTIVKINRDSIEYEKDGDRWQQNVRDGKKILISESPGQ